MVTKSCDPHDNPPLYETIDSDAFTALCTRGSPVVHFEYAGYDIEIISEQTVLISLND